VSTGPTARSSTNRGHRRRRAGPSPTKPHRQDRWWATAWSPEQISNRLKVEFPDDESIRIGHEAIVLALFIEGQGAPGSSLKSVVNPAELGLCGCARRRLSEV